MKRFLVILITFNLLVATGFAKPNFEKAAKARIEDNYVVVLWASGKKAIYPVSTLTSDDLAILTAIAEKRPLAKGSGRVEDYHPAEPRKVTIARNERVGDEEIVQLVLPNVVHDQGQTEACQFYALNHALQIAGYFVELDRLMDWQRIPERSYAQRDAYARLFSGEYGCGTSAELAESASAAVARCCPEARCNAVSWDRMTLQTQQKALAQSTKATYLRAKVSAVSQPENWEWIRDELRKGNPVIAGLVSDYWRVLPAAFFEHHRAPAIDSGHAVVVIGFTWNEALKSGTFRLVNSWEDQPEIVVSTEDARESLYGCLSITPKGGS